MHVPPLPSTPASTPAAPAALPSAVATALQQLVVKRGVALGGLSADERLLALAWVWAGLPEGWMGSEAAVNASLKALLAGPARCLDTDHVELRRWLVDGGWLQRDGYGREYRRSQPTWPAAAACAAACTAVLQGSDTASCAAAWQAAREEARAARRARWQAQGGQAT